MHGGMQKVAPQKTCDDCVKRESQDNSITNGKRNKTIGVQVGKLMDIISKAPDRMQGVHGEGLSSR
jgi:hypothetical protein